MLNTQALPILNRDLIARTNVGCDWLRLPLDIQGSAANKVVCQGTITTTEQTVEESTTNTWLSPPWMRMGSIAGNPIVISAAGINEFCRLDNLGQGGLLMCFDKYFTADVPTETLLSANPVDSVNGGWRLDQNTAGMLFRVKEQGKTTWADTGVANTVAAGWGPGRMTVLVYVSGANNLISFYARKGGKVDLTASTDTSSLLMPKLGDDGLGINCKVDSLGQSSTGEFYGISGDTPRSNNLIMLRPTTDVSGDIATFLNQYWTYRHQMPYVVRNWK